MATYAMTVAGALAAGLGGAAATGARVVAILLVAVAASWLLGRVVARLQRS